MSETGKRRETYGTGDVVMQEIWRMKDELSASYGHNVNRLFAEARKRQAASGRQVVNLQSKQRKAS